MSLVFMVATFVAGLALAIMIAEWVVRRCCERRRTDELVCLNDSPRPAGSEGSSFAPRAVDDTTSGENKIRCSNTRRPRNQL